MRITQRYRIEQAQDGRWIIVNFRDAALGWSGRCWVDRERTTGAQVMSFASADEAERYAAELFGRTGDTRDGQAAS